MATYFESMKMWKASKHIRGVLVEKWFHTRAAAERWEQS